eukprot:1114122-Rhodomonas_salina.2
MRLTDRVYKPTLTDRRCPAPTLTEACWVELEKPHVRAPHVRQFISLLHKQQHIADTLPTHAQHMLLPGRSIQRPHMASSTVRRFGTQRVLPPCCQTLSRPQKYPVYPGCAPNTDRCAEGNGLVGQMLIVPGGVRRM